jgi:hypothetical protein
VLGWKTEWQAKARRMYRGGATIDEIALDVNRSYDRVRHIVAGVAQVPIETKIAKKVMKSHGIRIYHAVRFEKRVSLSFVSILKDIVDA